MSPFLKHKNNNVFESHDLELHIKLDRSGGATLTPPPLPTPHPPMRLSVSSQPTCPLRIPQLDVLSHLRYRSLVFRCSCLYSYVSYSSVLSWIHVDNSSNCPRTTNSVSVFHYNYIVDPHVSPFDYPFLSWNQRGKDISFPSFPKSVHNLLTNSTRCRGLLDFLNGSCGTVEDACPSRRSLGHR